MGLGQSRNVQEAVCCGDVQRVRAAVSPANVNTTHDEDGWTALHYGAWAGRAEVVKELLLAGADTGLQEKAGRTALHLAALGGWSEAITLLCRHGAVVNARDSKGKAPLSYALGYGHREAAEVLMRWGGGSILYGPSGQASPAQQATAAQGQSSTQGSQELPAPSAPPLPSSLGNGHGGAEGVWGAHDLPLASGNNATQGFQRHQQGLMQNGDQLPETAFQAHGEAKALANALSSLGLHPIRPAPGYRVFRHEVLRTATRGFSQKNKMGNGAQNSDDLTMSYRGALPGARPGDKPTPVAVRKGLWAHVPDDLADRLAQLRHPNILPLLGVAQSPHSKRVDIVNPLMQYGSLEDGIHNRRVNVCDGGLPARRYYELDWQARTFIAAEVAAALLHLHGLGLTHGRLQPSTVLLGEGLTAKLGDSGLHCYGGLDVVYPFATTAACHNKLFIAPEVAEGGEWAEQADVYSFGRLLLNLLTGECWRSTANADTLTKELQSGNLERWLDPSARDWPLEDAAELCQLALRCTAKTVEARPSLSAEVLPTLNRLAQRAECHHHQIMPASSSAAAASVDPPAMLICPITQEVMTDPVVLADGHTYEKAAIQQWLSCGHDTSPMTNLRLSHRHVTPNYTLRSAAREWLAAHR